jgi:hypothetical protein
MSIISAGGAVVGAGGAAAPVYEIERSLRFNSANTAYLNKTFSTIPTDRAKKTVSFWYKRSTLSSTQNLFSSYNGGGQDGLYITSGNSLAIYAMGGGAGGTVNGVLRDPSAWYHILYVIDTTQATAGNRLKIWINGVNFPSGLWTAYSTPSLDSTADILFFQSTEIGRDDYNSSGYLDGYLTEIYYIDGQALNETYFGEFNATTGVWQPIEYTGTFGTNGFYLNFSDNSGVTAATLGADSSGNGNNWTPNNFVVSPVTSADNDSLVDTPTPYGTDTGAGGEVRGNYCTLNPLANSGIGTLSEGNLKLVTSTNSKTVTATMALPSTGQFYFEITATDYESGGGTSFGLVNNSFVTGFVVNGTFVGFNTYSGSYSNGTTTDTNGLSGTNVTNDGDIWCVAVDMTNGKFWIGRSRAGSLTWADGTTPAVNGSGATTIALPSGTLIPFAARGGSLNETYNFNFGQRAFAHAAPSGFQALVTTNIPAGTVTTSGSFTGNLATDGPFVYLNGVPTAMTINDNAVTFGTHADKLANGFKVRSSSSSYNASGSNDYSVSTTGEVFKNEVAQPNP